MHLNSQYSLPGDTRCWLPKPQLRRLGQVVYCDLQPTFPRATPLPLVQRAWFDGRSPRSRITGILFIHLNRTVRRDSGCWSQGATEAEALENIRDAIESYLSVVNEQIKGAEIREVEVAG